MADYDFITYRLATGGAITTIDDVRQLVEAGITHIIDCRMTDDRSLIAGFNEEETGPTHPRLRTHPRLQYLYNGVRDDGLPKSARWFGKSIVFALDAFTHRHTRVYVHCAAGVNRGPSTAFAILLAVGFKPKMVERLIRERRPQAGIRYKQDAISAVKKLGYR